MIKFLGILVAILLSLLVVDIFYLEDFYKTTPKTKPQKKDINATLLLKESIPSEALDMQKSESEYITVEEEIVEINYKNIFQEPTLLIIMDDISTIPQAKAIKKLRLNIVPSILPKTKDHPNTPKIAKMFRYVMLHLPLEAVDFPKPEIGTLNVKDSKEILSKKLDNYLKDFDNIIAINNHTGSKFTSNKVALSYLLKLLEKKSYLFIDSRTSSKSKYIEIQKEKGKKIFHRDIFLDNIQEISYIKSQIKKAVLLAQKRGFAIAICHPHLATFKAINQSRKLLKKVRLVNIDALRDKKIRKVTKRVQIDRKSP